MAIAASLLKKLVQIPIFQGLTVPEAAEFFEVSTEALAQKGTLLFAEGDAGDSLLVILEGEVEVTKRGIELATVGQHSVLGEMSLVGSEASRSATATAKGDVRYLKIPSKRVQKLLKANSMATLKVFANLAQMLSKRLALINEKFVDSKGKKREELADFGKILNRWQF
jgi:CRP-like cAMP-binding protein